MGIFVQLIIKKKIAKSDNNFVFILVFLELGFCKFLFFEI